MQYTVLENTCCGGDALNICMAQGETQETVILFDYDVTETEYNMVVKFPTPIIYSIGSGLEYNENSNYSIIWTPDSADTENVPAGQYPFELWNMDAETPSVNVEEMTGFVTINTAQLRIP